MNRDSRRRRGHSFGTKPAIKRCLLASVSFTLLAIFSGATAAAQSAASPQIESNEEIAPYLNPQRLVRIPGGRTINVVCLGHGSPTVVLTSGLGGWSQVWYLIQRPLSSKTRVCAWDPAGLGFSSPSPNRQDALHETEDLEEALKGAQLNGPYVMVAHSAGAAVALLFTDQHRRAVAGMVLVDPSIPDETAIRNRVAPKFAAFGDAAPRAAMEQLRQCAAKLRSGALKPGTPEFERCTTEPLPPAFSRLSARLARLNANPARLLTQVSAMENAALLSSDEIVNPKRNYGDMPLIVLTSGSHPMPPGVPAVVRDQAAAYFRALASGHDALARLSTRGHNDLVPSSGHFIQLDDPTVVLAAINRVVADIPSGEDGAKKSGAK